MTTQEVRLVGGPIHGRLVTVPSLDRVSYGYAYPGHDGTRHGQYVPIRPEFGSDLYWAGSGAIEPPEPVSRTFSTLVGGGAQNLSAVLELLKTINQRGLIHGPMIRTEDPTTKKVTIGFFCVRGDLA